MAPVWQRLQDAVLEPGRLERALLAVAGTVAVLVAARVVVRLGERAVDRLLRAERRAPELAARLVTLRSLLRSLLRYGVTLAAAVAILALLGINPGALLAGIGIAGLALGFGAQNLVRDVIAGFFILYEDQFRVGEHVAIDGIEGVVEEMGLRVTRIRDFGGQLHVVPNGTIQRVTNFARGPLRVLFPVLVAHEADVDRAMAAIQRACDALRAEDPRVVEGPRALGVSNLTPNGVEILVWALARPGQQWDVERQLRIRIKRVLDAEGIEVPYPRRVMITVPGGAEPARPAAAGEGAAAPSHPEGEGGVR